MDGPVYIRLSRMPVPNLDIANRSFKPGTAELVREGSDVAIIACGTMVHLAAAAADKLASEGISACVLNMATLNPLDEAAVASAAETGAIVTVEEAGIRGGLGGAVAEFTSGNLPVPVERMGFPGFVPTGSVEWLFDHFGLTPAGIASGAQAGNRPQALMAADYILAIDQGTSNTKAVLVDTSGQIIARASCPLTSS